MSDSMIGRLTCLDDSRLPDHQKGLAIELFAGETTVGRGAENNTVITHGSISRKHALITALNGDVVIKDLNSTNGVRINGEKITEARMGNGDTVGFGSLLFRFKTVEHEKTESAPTSDSAEAEQEPPAAPLATSPPADIPEPDAAPEPAQETAPEPEQKPEPAPENEPEPKPHPDTGTEPAPEPDTEPDTDQDTFPDEEDLADRTMLFGDARAGQAILDAREQDDEEPEEPAPEPLRTEAPATETEPEAAPPAKSRMPFYLATAGIIILAACTWWFIQARRTAADEAVIRIHAQEINDFAAEHEFWTRRFSYRQSAAQLAQLDRIIKSLEKDIEAHPRLDPLKPLLVEAHFYKLEREVRALLGKKRPEDALALVDEVRAKAREFLDHPDTRSEETKSALSSFISLADLLDIVARYKLFQKKYQNLPYNGQETIPESARNEIAAAKLMKHRFAALLKENNMVLKVRFRLLRGMAADADENCVLLVNRRHHSVFGPGTGAGSEDHGNTRPGEHPGNG